MKGLDIDVVTKANYIELKFVKMEDDFDESLFTKEELKTINKAIERYKNETPRKMANVCFTIDKVRETKNGEIII
jgi:phage regulator Rha-like protein